jgi:hypothetical protein
MTDQIAYNYPVFPPATDASDFAAFPDHLKVGHPAPDGRLTALDGGEVQLSDLWRVTNLVLEFGSIT